MPTEPSGRVMRNKGFAIINFKHAESAAKAILQGEISISFAAVQIEQSYQQQRRNDRDGDRRQFDNLTRKRQ